jgi:hypothetical protein
MVSNQNERLSIPESRPISRLTERCKSDDHWQDLPSHEAHCIGLGHDIDGLDEFQREL